MTTEPMDVTPEPMDGVYAWECENCGQWRPASGPAREDPYAVVVDVPLATEVYMEGAYSKRLRARRVMVVCVVCHGLMGSGKRP